MKNGFDFKAKLDEYAQAYFMHHYNCNRTMDYDAYADVFEVKKLYFELLSAFENEESWIKCSDGAPEEEEDVFVYATPVIDFEDMRKSIIYYQPTMVAALFKDKWYKDGREVLGVTHWRPLPPSPESESANK